MTISFSLLTFNSTFRFFLVLSIEDIGISCLLSSPFIKLIKRINFVFSKSILLKLIRALTISLPTSLSSVCAKDPSGIPSPSLSLPDSHASPIPSPSESLCSGFATSGQLSTLLGTVYAKDNSPYEEKNNMLVTKDMTIIRNRII